MEEIDLIRKIHSTKIEFKMCPDLWGLEGIDFSQTTFKETKFLNDLGTAMHENMNNLPSTSGGIYFLHKTGYTA